jgi:hypothetical protein
MKIDKVSVDKVVSDYGFLLNLACGFLCSVSPRLKNDRRGVSSYVDEESIRIDSHEVSYTYEYNDSCHCHPNMVTEKESYPLIDFIKWIENDKVDWPEND